MEIRNGDLTLHLATDGPEDAPPILLLHGITSCWRTWDWLVPHLADRYRVLRLDFRGHGRSDRAAGEYHVAGYVSDAAAAVDAAGGPSIVLGHSLGGVTTAGLTQHHPDLVRAALMEDPPIPAAARTLEGNSLLDGFRLMRQSIPMMQEQKVPEDVLAGILANAPSATGPTFGTLVHPDGLSSMAAGMLHVDATVLDPVLSGQPLDPFYDPNAPLGRPALLITADPTAPDAVARAEDGARFAEVNPGATVTVMTGAGHLIHDELASRDRFLAAVTEFLATLG